MRSSRVSAGESAERSQQTVLRLRLWAFLSNGRRTDRSLCKGPSRTSVTFGIQRDCSCPACTTFTPLHVLAEVRPCGYEYCEPSERPRAATPGHRGGGPRRRASPCWEGDCQIVTCNPDPRFEAELLFSEDTLEPSNEPPELHLSAPRPRGDLVGSHAGRIVRCALPQAGNASPTRGKPLGGKQSFRGRPPQQPALARSHGENNLRPGRRSRGHLSQSTLPSGELIRASSAVAGPRPTAPTALHHAALLHSAPDTARGAPTSSAPPTCPVEMASESREGGGPEETRAARRARGSECVLSACCEGVLRLTREMCRAVCSNARSLRRARAGEPDFSRRLKI